MGIWPVEQHKPDVVILSYWVCVDRFFHHLGFMETRTIENQIIRILLYYKFSRAVQIYHLYWSTFTRMTIQEGLEWGVGLEINTLWLHFQNYI